MLSEVLSGAVKVRQVLLEEPGYLLARVEVRGGLCYAEAAPAGPGSTPVAWPSLQGLARPVADRKTDSGHRLVFFRDIMGRSLIEEMGSGGMPARRAIDTAISLGGVLRNLHLKGMVLGYIGPESVFRAPDGTITVSAGLRGVPESHFSAPEAVGTRPIDPRSDVFALGTFLTRLLAGADDHDSVIRAWNSMDPDLRSVIERMVAEDPGDRPSNMAEVISLLRGLELAVPPAPHPEPAAVMPPMAEPPAGPERRRRRGLLPVVIIAALAVLAVVYVLFSPGPSDGPGGSGPPVEPTPDTLATPPADTLPPAADSAAVPGGVSVADAVVWISNCTGAGGAASAFREGPARDYPHAYPSTGARRTSSVLLVRRSEPGTSLRGQPEWPLAESLASWDTTMAILPVDVTILLGTDLSYPGVNASVLRDPSSPADTIYVDVVNQGLQYTLDGAGPASWTRALLDGRCVELGGIEYLISVVDARDGDRSPNEEIGLAALLDRTTFLYRTDSGLLPGFEGCVRQLLQAVPDEVAGPPDSVPVPDFWVLLGRS